MPRFPTALAPILLTLAAPVGAHDLDPLRFFEGRTENEGTAKVIFHKPYRTHTIGQGRIERDGSRDMSGAGRCTKPVPADTLASCRTPKDRSRSKGLETNTASASG